MSLYKGDMNSRILAGEKMEDVLKNLDAPKTDWKLGNWSGGINPYDMYTNVTTTRVLCKDGTVAFESSSENAKYDNSKTCINNGGRAEIKPVVNETVKYGVIKQDAEEKFYESLGLKSSMFFTLKSKGRLLVAVVLIAGYFAYKKFKK